MNNITGWFYLHVNKDLIFKNDSEAIADIRDSDLCHTAWAWNGTKETAWNILVEAQALDAKPERIQKLVKDWGCTDEDASNYAEAVGVDLDEDGNQKTAKRKDFENLQESPCGFGDTYLDAMAALCKELGYTGGKMWNATFKTLLETVPA